MTNDETMADPQPERAYDLEERTARFGEDVIRFAKRILRFRWYRQPGDFSRQCGLCTASQPEDAHPYDMRHDETCQIGEAADFIRWEKEAVDG